MVYTPKSIQTAPIICITRDRKFSDETERYIRLYASGLNLRFDMLENPAQLKTYYDKFIVRNGKHPAKLVVLFDLDSPDETRTQHWSDVQEFLGERIQLIPDNHDQIIIANDDSTTHGFVKSRTNSAFYNKRLHPHTLLFHVLLESLLKDATLSRNDMENILGIGLLPVAEAEDRAETLTTKLSSSVLINDQRRADDFLKEILLYLSPRPGTERV